MSKTIALFGASALAWAVLAGHAEAKRVSYEINGQTYWYSTNNRQQVEEARQRIEAANAAQAAQAKAQAEAAANPLVKIFGSPTQRQAAQAQAAVSSLVTAPAAEPEATDSISGRRGNARRAQHDEEPQVEKPRRASKAEKRARQAVASAESPALQAAAAEALPAGTVPSPGIKSVSFDLASGIKTVHLADGSVREEPIDGGLLSKLGTLEPSVNDLLTNFVNMVRKPAPGDVTGATGRASGGGPGLPASN